MLAELTAAGKLSDEWRAAFGAVPRHLFVPDEIWIGDTTPLHVVRRSEDPGRWLDLVYTDEPVVTQIDHGSGGGRPTSSTSMPSIVAGMLTSAELASGMTVLEIGTGTGWNTALLCARLGDHAVTSVEIDPDLAESARRNLAAVGMHPAVLTADGTGGHAAAAQYDRVLSTVAARTVPYAWIEQTHPGGLVVTPWSSVYTSALATLRVAADRRSASGRFGLDIAFMPLRSQRIEPVVFDIPEDAARTLVDYYPYEVFNKDGGMFAAGLLLAGVHWEVERRDGDAFTVWLADPDTGSMAELVVDEPASYRFTARQHGPRRLLDELERAEKWWHERDRPPIGRFGLTVAAEDQWTWLDVPAKRISGVGP